MQLSLGNYLGSKSATTSILAPTNLSITVDSDTQITLTWINNAVNYDTIHIERSLNGVDFTEIDDVVKGTTTYANCGLSGDTLYYYRIRAKYNNVYSEYSEIKSATTDVSSLIASWTNGSIYSYETFTSSNGATIESAINTSGLASCVSNSLAIVTSEQYKATFTLTKNSGVLPQMAFYDNGEAISGESSNKVTCSEGSNDITFTITSDRASAELIFRTAGSGDQLDFEISDFVLVKL